MPAWDESLAGLPIHNESPSLCITDPLTKLDWRLGAQQVMQVQTTSRYTNLPQTLAQNIKYTPWGALSALQNGFTGSGVNAQETYQYNNRMQPAVIELTIPSIPAGGYCLVYDYYGSGPTSCTLPSQGTNNNGNVMGY